MPPKSINKALATKPKNTKVINEPESESENDADSNSEETDTDIDDETNIEDQDEKDDADEKDDEEKLGKDDVEAEEDDEEEEPEEEEKEESIKNDDNIEDDDKKEDDDDCLYNFKQSKKKGDKEPEFFEEYEEVFDDDNIVYNEIVKDSERTTKPLLSIYERVRVLGDRARQLLEGAKPMIKGTENIAPKKIAQLELEKGVLPLKIVRELPNGKKEVWKINELKIVN